MKKLEKRRGKGRNDYPIRPLWNSILAGIVYQHSSIASLIRELLRNGELREMCGFNPAGGAQAVPPDWVYTRFLKLLFRCQEEIDMMFHGLVEEIRKYLPDLGEYLAIDSKAIDSAGKPTKSDQPDGRRDTDADWGSKTYRGVRKDGTMWEKVKSWFGYKLHLVVDAKHELPLGYEVTKASASDCPWLLPIIEQLQDHHPAVIDRADFLAADKGYDSKVNNEELYDRYGIKPIIPIREDWKDGEKTRPLFPDRADNIVTDEHGSVYCAYGLQDGFEATICLRPMCFYGFEADRMTLKYRCPAAAYGCSCPDRDDCSPTSYGRVVRVPMELNRRRFVPVPRSSLKWERLYKMRSSVERVNSRLDVSFGFERHFIRGMKKMKLRAGLALVVMLAMALGSLQAGCHEKVRSLVWSGGLKAVA